MNKAQEVWFDSIDAIVKEQGFVCSEIKEQIKTVRLCAKPITITQLVAIQIKHEETGTLIGVSGRSFLAAKKAIKSVI